MAWFGLFQKIQAAENTLPKHQVSAAPTKTQPQLVASYGKLPLSFEANQGQTDARVRFLARGSGYTIFLTDDEAVLTLKKSSVVSGQSSVAPTGTRHGMSRWGERGIPGRLGPFGPFGPRAGRWPSLADQMRSLWPSLLPDHSQMLPDPNAGKEAETGIESQQVMRMRLVGGNAQGRVVGLDELPGRSNYFIGNDPKKWRTNVPSYARVKYEGVYPGVDLVYYGNQRQLEYDFVVAPGADPNQIKLSFAGADGMRVDAASGDLVMKVGNDEVRFHKPAVSQPVVAAVSSPPSKPVAALSERRRRSETAATAELDGAFVLASNNQVAFRVAGYDPQRALVIDPVLVYSTYLGGSGYDSGTAIAVDAAGSAYVTGFTSSTDFPTANALQATYGGGTWDVYVTKLNPTGSALVYSTYLGGSNSDVGADIAVDSFGNAYVTGYTQSTDFPTVNALQPTNHGGWDAFVARLNAAGSALVYSTYLGGSSEDVGNGIAVDSFGNAYVTGQTWSTDFPTANPLQATNKATGVGGGNVFVAELNSTGSALAYSTYLGGSMNDGGLGIAVDAAGNAYLTGATSSTDFPTVNPLQATNRDDYNAFVAKLNAAGSALVYSTYLGGSGNGYTNGWRIAVDSSGNAYVTGYTQSTDFPTVNALQPTNYGGWDAFVAKLNAAGSALVYSTYLGGSGYDSSYGIAVDAAGNAYVVGITNSPDFPTVNPFQATCGGCNASTGIYDAFVAELNAAGSALVYSTYLGGSSNESVGGIAVDAAGNAYVMGVTDSTDFPTVNPLQATNHGSYDAFVAKISPGGAPAVNLTLPSFTFGPQQLGTTSAAQAETVTNTGTANLTISTVTIGGTNAGDFATSADTCTGATLTPNGTCAVSVTFTPSAMGSRSASLNFTDNAAGSPQSITLAGTGIAAATTTAVSAPAITYGGVAPVTVSVTSEQGTVAGNVSLSVDNGSPLTQPLSGGSAIFSISGLGGGSHSLSASYAAQGAFLASSATGTLQVNPAAPTVTFTGAPASAVYNSSFTVASTTNASTAAVITASGACSIAGNIVTMTSGTGTCLLTANWGADANYRGASLSQSTAAAKATPLVVWPTPGNINYTTPLSATQLDAMAVSNTLAVAGTFVYTPPAGTYLPYGNHQALSVAFTPADNTDFNAASGTVYINVIDTVPPVITISANPSSLWPPNGKSVPVTVSGAITDSGSGVNPSTLVCNVVDSEGLVHPACSVGSLGAGGAYSFTVLLVASRDGNDKNGRTYTITVSASDYAGNSASVSTAVIVPHDQGN
jgi:hypothetical protein